MSLSEEEKLRAAEKEIAEFATHDVKPIDIAIFKKRLNKEYKLSASDFKLIYKDKRESFLEKLRQEEKEMREAAIAKKLLFTETSLSRIIELHQQITSTSPDLLIIVLANYISQKISKINGLPMFWILIVDVPSGDKTVHLLLAKDVPFIVFRDAVTAGSFGSGYVDQKTGKGQEEDFLNILNEKVFVVKDLSATFSKDPKQVKEFIGIMTNVYDQSFIKQTGTLGATGADKCAFAHAAGITDLTLDNHHRYIAMLGPRYFMYRKPKLTKEQENKGLELLWNSPEMKAKKEQLTELCSAYLFQLNQKPDSFFEESELDQESKKFINTLSRLQARLRAYCGIDREQNEERYDKKNRLRNSD